MRATSPAQSSAIARRQARAWRRRRQEGRRADWPVPAPPITTSSAARSSIAPPPLFAQNGYDRTSMAKSRAACGVSQGPALSLLRQQGRRCCSTSCSEHLQEAGRRRRRGGPHACRRGRACARWSGALLEAYRDADHEHKIQINEMSKLPPERHRELVGHGARAGRVSSPNRSPPVLPAIGTRQGAAQAGDHVAVRHAELALHVVSRRRGSMSRITYADLATNILDRCGRR